MEKQGKGITAIIEDTSSTACFRAAVREALKRQPHGAKSKLAKKLSISKQYLSDLINKKGKTIPDNIKDKIAAALDTTVADLLMIGDYFIRTGIYFPYVREVQQFPMNSPERALYIFVKAQEEYHVFFPGIEEELVQHINIPFVQKYLAVELNDGEFYSKCISLLKEILAYYLPKSEK